MALGLQDILSQVASAGSVIDTGSKQIEGWLSDAAGLSMDSNALLKTAASDASLVSATKSAADLSTQSARQALGIKFGTDENAQNQVYTALTDKIAATYKTKSALEDIINQKLAIGMDDPIAYIGAQLTVNRDIQQHNAVNSELQGTFDQIDRLNKSTSDSAQLQTQFSNTVTVASAEAAARLASTEAQVKANQMATQALTFNVEGVKTALGATKEELDNLFKVKQLQISTANNDIAAGHLALAQQEFAFRMEEKLKTDGMDSSILNSINIGRASRGLGGLDKLKAQVALAALKGKGPMSDEFLADYKSGEMALATGQISLGATPADVIQRIGERQVLNVSPPQELVKQKLGDALAIASPQLKSLDPRDLAGAQRILNVEVGKVVQRDAAEVKPNDASNLFSIAPIASIVKVSPAAANEPVYQKVLKPLMDTGVDMNDPNQVMAATVAAIKKGTISYNDALGLATIYQAGSNANLAQRDLPKFGIPPVYAYNVRLNNAGGFGGTSIVDVTKVDLLGRYLNKQLVNNLDTNQPLLVSPAGLIRRLAPADTTTDGVTQ